MRRCIRSTRRDQGIVGSYFALKIERLAQLADASENFPMRLDKLTTKFQEALADAQSIAIARDNPYIEPVHLLSAMLAQAEGPKALLARAGVNTAKLQPALEAEINKLPQVQGGEQVQPSRDLVGLLQQAEKEAGKRGDQFIAS